VREDSPIAVEELAHHVVARALVAVRQRVVSNDPGAVDGRLGVKRWEELKVAESREWSGKGSARKIEHPRHPGKTLRIDAGV